MPVTDEQVERVLKEISVGADHPQHVASLVGAFMRRQPTVGHYVQSHSSDLGMEGVVLTLLHASAIVRAVELSQGRALRVLAAADLDRASKAGGELKGEKAIETYLSSNLTDDDPTLGGKKRPVVLQLLRLVARASIDI